MKRIIIVLTFLVQIFGQEKVRYDDYQVYRLIPKTQESLDILKYLERTSLDYSFWTGVKTINQDVDIMVPPQLISEFEEIVNKNEFESKVIIPNVQKLIDNERVNAKADPVYGWDDYYSLLDMAYWMGELADNYTDIVTLVKGGTTYQGRGIIGAHLSFAPGNENRSVFLEANIHACEWIGSSVATYIMNELVTSTDPEVRKVAESHDWYIFPVINPDGFSYSHSTDRLWRKTRVPHGDKCIGADPNRNWAYHYNEGGTSDDPCSENYRGPEAFSEPSMKSLSEYITTIGPSLEAYISFHSYSQVLLIPYGYTSEHLDNFDELKSIGEKAIDALSQRYGTKYEVGSIPELMYIASGNSPDWVKGTFGTRITYTYELRDRGEYGFLLPADQIRPTAEETFDSFITIFNEADKRT